MDAAGDVDGDRDLHAIDLRLAPVDVELDLRTAARAEDHDRNHERATRRERPRESPHELLTWTVSVRL